MRDDNLAARSMADRPRTFNSKEQITISAPKEAEFCMDKTCNVAWNKLFHEKGQSLEFRTDANGILDLGLFEDLYPRWGEVFLPQKVYVRSVMQKALRDRLVYPNGTVLFGSPGVGKSVFAFLSAIAMVVKGKHPYVFYARKVLNDNEPTTSVFWMVKDSPTKVLIQACQYVDGQLTLDVVRDALMRTAFPKKPPSCEFSWKCWR